MAAIDYYPVGSIYMSLDDTSPASFMGGSWNQLTETFLLGSGTTYSVGDPDLGETMHTLTIPEMPSHRHNLNFRTKDSNGGTTYAYQWNSRSRWNPSTSATGGGQPHNNMPPYVVVNMWERTA